MGRKKLDENDYQNIIQLKQNGYTTVELANMFNVTNSRIGQILRENGISSTNNRYLVFSDADRKRIVELYQQGTSAVNIGKIFNCSKTPITKVLNECGITLDNVNRKILESEYQNLIDMYSGGMTQKEIANVYGCSEPVVQQIMKKMNVKTRPNGFTKEDAENMYELYKTGIKLPEIAIRYNTDRHTVGKVLKRNGFSADRKTYHCDEHYFDKIDTQDKAYIAGLLWADGCNQLNRGKITIQLQEKDSGILEQIKEASNNERPLYKVALNDKNPNWQNSVTLTWQSKHMSQVFNDYGMVPRKSLVLEFPSWMDEKLYPHFIRGYIDGDGSMYYSQEKNTFRVSMIGTKMFLDVTQNIFENLGVKTSMYHKNGHNDVTYTLATTSNIGSLQLSDWIYKDANLKLQRKYDKYQQALKRYNINNSLAS